MVRPNVGGLAAGAVLGLLALSTVLSAQTLPLPTLPEEQVVVEPADRDPSADAAPAAEEQVRPPAWEYGLGVGAAWDSNVGFLVPDGPSSWAVVPRGNLARLFRSRKGQLRVAGAGYWARYKDQQDLHTYDATFSVDGKLSSSVRTTWTASGSYSLGYSDSSFVLAEQGVLLPLVKTRTLAGSLGVRRKLGLKTAFRLDGRIYQTVFDEGPTRGTGLSDGQSIRGTGGLERTLGQRDSIALEYSLESTLGRAVADAADLKGSYYVTHYGSLLWTHILSPRSGLMLEAGSSYTPEAGDAGLGQGASFFGGASFSRRVKSSSVALFARREVAPAFGLGLSRLENRFGLNATIPMARVWLLRLSVTHVMPETPEGAEASYSTPDEAFFALGRRIGRIFEISAEARYRRRGSTSTFPAIDGYRAGVFLSLLSPNGRSQARPAGR